MSTVESVQKVFAGVAPELDSREYRAVNQRYWGLKLGLTQQTVSTGLEKLCSDGIFEKGTPEGNQHTYRVNRTHPALQQG